MNPIKRNIRIIFILALLVVFVPAFGIPGEWKTYLHVALGMAIFIVTFLLHRDLTIGLGKQMPKKEMVTEAFSEGGVTEHKPSHGKY